MDRMKSFKECIQTLVQTAGGDGNLLFNVGPMPDGRIEPRQVERLEEMGEWLRANGESVYGTRGGPFLPGEWGCSTHKDGKIYVHVFKWDGNKVQLPPLERTIQSASVLGGGTAEFRQDENGVELRVPRTKQDGVDTIVVLRTASPQS